MTSEGYHEPYELLDAATLERHRAIVSLMEELEAIDWYDQRIAVTSDDALRAVLAHNRDEEKEHAVMTLEWLRRRDPVLDAQLRKYLFHEGDIVAAEEHAAEEHAEATAAERAARPSDGSLGIGSLRRKERP